MWTVSTLLRTVVRFRVCVWDSVSNADGIAGGNALPRARARGESKLAFWQFCLSSLLMLMRAWSRHSTTFCR